MDDAAVPALDDQLIALVLSGSKVIESRHGKLWRRGTYVPGRLGLTAPGQPAQVRWRTTSPMRQRALHVHLPGRLLADAAEQLWGVDAAPVVMPDALVTEDPVVEHVVRALDRAAEARADDLYAESAATFLAVHLVSRHAGLGDAPPLGRDDRRVQRAEEFMRDNVHVPMNLDDIAAAVHLSKFHLVRLFTAATGEPPRRFLTRLRIDAARHHLLETRSGLAEVASACGFTSADHLAAAFRRETGQSPTAFRRAHAARPARGGAQVQERAQAPPGG